MHHGNPFFIDSGGDGMVEPLEMLRYVYGYFGFFSWSQSRRREVPLP
jgi:hypothetical protein